MMATENLTLVFICTLHRRMAGKIERLKSAAISMAE